MVKKINGTKLPGLDPTKEVVECGSAVQLTDAVLKHGIIFVHPEMPLVRLRLHFDEKEKRIDKYNFELVKPTKDETTGFAIVVIPPAPPKEPAVVVRKKRLLGPNGEELI